MDILDAVKAGERALDAMERDAERYRWLRKELLWCRGYSGNVRWAIERRLCT